MLAISLYPEMIAKFIMIPLSIVGIIPKRKMIAGSADTANCWKDMDGW